MRVRSKLASIFAITLVLAVIVTMLPSCGDKSQESHKTQTTIEVPVNAIFEMVSLNGGIFNISSNTQVTLSPFSMSRYEITFNQYINVRDWGSSHGYSFNNVNNDGSICFISPHISPYGALDMDDLPVEDIDWYDAVLWCNALSEMEGRMPCYYTSASQSTVYRTGRINIQNDWVKWDANGYRLPTEAEWEYACRAGTTTNYSFGNIISRNDANYGNFGGNGLGSQFIGAMPVGSYAANPWGLYDMHGNVKEWCWDWYGNYVSGATNDPRGPSSGSYRVLRGGGWNDYLEHHVQSADRDYYNPDRRNCGIGFRPVNSR